MRAWVVLVALIACGPGLKRTDEYRHPKLHDFAARLTEGSRNRDVRGVRELLRDSVMVSGLWFEDIECTKRFSSPGEVRGSRLDELARCLTTLELELGAREDALPDVVILTYGPGIEVEARFIEGADGAWLAWIGYVARRNVQDALPTVAATKLEALRLEGDPREPQAGPGAFDEPNAFAWLKVCVDANGSVTGAHVRQASSPKAARVFAAAVLTWKFRPFTLRGQPTPVCSMMLTRYPADVPVIKETLPLPLPDSPTELTIVPAAALGPRIAGETMVAPSRGERKLVGNSSERVIGAFLFCLNDKGTVFRVSMIRSTGLREYDQRLIATVGSWVYKPFLDEGRPVAVCSSVRFIYTQN